MSKFIYHLITSSEEYSVPYFLLAREAEAAGVHFFHLREKQWPVRQFLRIADEIRPNLRKSKFIVNGRLDAALAAKADGVHLQHGNVPVPVIRKKFPNLMIGYSAHSREELLRVQEDGADFAFLSPIYRPLSKAKALQPIGVLEASKWIRDVRMPVIALGGIVPEKLQELKQGGFAGAAGITLFSEKGNFSYKGMVV